MKTYTIAVTFTASDDADATHRTKRIMAALEDFGCSEPIVAEVEPDAERSPGLTDAIPGTNLAQQIAAGGDPTLTPAPEL